MTPPPGSAAQRRPDRLGAALLLVLLAALAACGDPTNGRPVLATATPLRNVEGAVQREGGALILAGPARAELTVVARGREALTGRFVPPADVQPNQRWNLTLYAADGWIIRRYAWTPSAWNRLLGARTVRLPLRGYGGAVRLRFEAAGAGPPARWEGLALRGE